MSARLLRTPTSTTVKPVKVSINATTGRDEVLLFEFEVNPLQEKEEIYNDIVQFCRIADHRRGERNINFLKYQQLLRNLSPEVVEAAQMAIDFLYGNPTASMQPDQPDLAPNVRQQVDEALAQSEEMHQPLEDATKEIEGPEGDE